MKVKKYMVSPSLPKELEPLLEITKNFWWCWNQKAVNLLRNINLDLWEKVYHNPIRILGESDQSVFEDMLEDDAAMMALSEVYDEFKTYMKQETWYDSLDSSQKTKGEKIAYFSFEYGLHESLPNYSGGLGILSGDHLKSASDLGLPLVAVGLLYRKGYFRQYLNAEGWQQEYDIENDFFNLALEKVLDKNGEPVKIDVDLPGRKVYAQIWKAERDGGKFDVKLSNGVDIDFSVSGDWIKIDAEYIAIPMNVLPNAVASSIKSKYPEASVIEVEKNFGNFKIKLNNFMELYMSANGQIVAQKWDD